jgi:hypothetical protein
VAALVGLPAALVAPTSPLLVSLAVVLAVQLAVLRPRLDRRARAVQRGQTPPRSPTHLAYIALEVVKVVLLVAIGCWLALAPTLDASAIDP